LRHYVIPEVFFKAIAEKGKLYSRVWFYWLSEFVDELFEPEFIEKQQKAYSGVSEIKEIYEFGVQFLIQHNFKVIEEKGKSKKQYKVLSKETTKIARQVLEYLNSKANSTFSTQTGNNLQLIAARIDEGYSISEFKSVIDKKVIDWKGTDWERYLRPMTLFSKTKFENYLNSTNEPDTKHTKFSKFADSVARAKTIIALRTN
jgi:uncharacterized phage protein (TIGR02220 family)